MDTIKTIFKLISLVIAGLLAILIIFSFTGLILTFVAFVFGVIFISWVCGYPIVVKSNDVPIGYIRWTKFYPY